MKIEFDEFRTDVRRKDGSLIQANVLFVRGTTETIGTDDVRKTIEFHCPVWDEEESTKEYDPRLPVKNLLALQIGRYMRIYDLRNFG